MAAGWQWSQSHGAGETKVDLGASGNLFNFKNKDDASGANYASWPITAGNNSYEVYLRGHFTPTYNKIENIQFWNSSGFSPATGLTLKWDGSGVTYAQPVATTSSKATKSIPTTDPGTANVTMAGTLAGSLTSASGFTDYIVLQLQTTTSAAAGDTSLAKFTMQYDES
jgi:hypothetical protein